ncbi:hypothetical protein ACFLTS_03170 [Chloroflexota bacterium]
MNSKVPNAIGSVVFLVGLLLGIIGWSTTAYSSNTATIIFLCCLFGSMVIKILLNLKVRNT